MAPERASRRSVHDDFIPEQGKAIPYGVYDVTRNEGWVSVGIDHDTASSPCGRSGNGSGGWGRRATGAPELYHRRRGREQRVAGPAVEAGIAAAGRRTGLAIPVCHLPPGTSKWNKIEHRLFSQIRTNWRGRPFTSLDAIVNLIGNTRTPTGLRGRCELERGAYPKGHDVSDAQMATLHSSRIPSMATGTTRLLRPVSGEEFVHLFPDDPLRRSSASPSISDQA